MKILSDNKKGNKESKSCRKSKDSKYMDWKIFQIRMDLIFFPNHQGMFDVLVFFGFMSKAFFFCGEKKKQVILSFKAGHQSARGISHGQGNDLKQSMKVINAVAEDVKNGKNFLIFPEGTESRMGNKF